VTVRQGAVVSPELVRRRQPRAHPEADFQKLVVDYARARGWLCHFLPDWLYRLALRDMQQRRRADRDWPDSGFVDLVLARDGAVLLVELKSDRGRLSDGQLRWTRAGLDYCVWRPKTWEQDKEVLE
jgi:hypothetical protein